MNDSIKGWKCCECSFEHKESEAVAKHLRVVHNYPYDDSFMIDPIEEPVKLDHKLNLLNHMKDFNLIVEHAQSYCPKGHYYDGNYNMDDKTISFRFDCQGTDSEYVGVDLKIFQDEVNNNIELRAFDEKVKAK